MHYKNLELEELLLSLHTNLDRIQIGSGAGDSVEPTPTLENTALTSASLCKTVEKNFKERLSREISFARIKLALVSISCRSNVSSNKGISLQKV